MTFEDYWNKVCDKNKSFKDRDMVTIKVSSIRALMEQAYNKGYEHVEDDGIDGEYQNSYKNVDAVNELKNIFGMK